jgi:hypothetical protein
MRPSFKSTANTRALVGLFQGMKLNERMSYGDASKELGFTVTAAESATARKIAERDHEIFIAIIPGFGFLRGTHADMADSGPSFLLKSRRNSKRGAARMELALKGNLDEDRHQAASEMFSRFQIIHSTSEKPMVFSNRKKRAT